MFNRWCIRSVTVLCTYRATVDRQLMVTLPCVRLHKTTFALWSRQWALCYGHVNFVRTPVRMDSALVTLTNTKHKCPLHSRFSKWARRIPTDPRCLSNSTHNWCCFVSYRPELRNCIQLFSILQNLLVMLL